MSISVVSQLLSPKASMAANQGTATLLGRFVTLFQSPRFALPTLVVSTAIGTCLGFIVALLAYGTFQVMADHNWFVPNNSILLVEVGISASCGALTVVGMNVGTSKFLKLPFSRSSSFAISLVTLSAIALGLLWSTGVLSIACQSND